MNVRVLVTTSGVLQLSFYSRNKYLATVVVVQETENSSAQLSFYSRKKYLATVQETQNSSAWDHIFNIQRQGPPRRRTRKVLSLWHNHGKAPRGSYPACPILARWKLSELDRKTNCPQEKKGGKRASIGFVVGTFLCFVGSAPQVKQANKQNRDCNTQH